MAAARPTSSQSERERMASEECEVLKRSVNPASMSPIRLYAPVARVSLMPSLVEQLQRDAADPSISVGTLLRRAKISAKKLGLKTVENWIEHELNGYTGDVPDYRKAVGRLVAWNPYHGWIPISGDADFIEKVSTTYTVQSIDELESLLAGKDANLAVELSPHTTALLDRVMNVPLHRYVLKLGRPVVIRIVNAVRNAVLEWALSLEEAEIVGSDFSFSNEEKQTAREHAVAIKIGNIESFVGNLGSGNASGDISASDIDIRSVRRLVEQLRPAIHDAGFAPDETDRLKPLVDALGREASKESPNGGLLKGILQDIRAALVGTSGNLIASGLIYEISKIFPG